MAKQKQIVTVIQTRAYLSKDGHTLLDARFQEHCRLYNAAIQERRDAYRQAGKSITFYDQCKSMKEIRGDWKDWSNEALRVQRGTLKRVDRAFQAFFRRVKAGEAPGFPRFKSAWRFRTLTVEDAKGVPFDYDPETGKGAVRVKGWPRLRFKCARIPPKARPLDIKITRRPNGVKPNVVYLSMSFNLGDAPAVAEERPSKPVGIDVGVSKRAMLSSGERIEGRVRDMRKKRRLERKMQRQRDAALRDGRAEYVNRGVSPKTGQRQYRFERKKRRLERKMQRQRDAALRDGRAEYVNRGVSPKTGQRQYRLEWVGGMPSHGYRKTRAQRERLLHRENVRDRNKMHRETTEIVRNHDAIFVEDLQVKNMMRSAKGTVEEPGRNVAQKTGLNRSMSEQAWSTFFFMLEYKAERAGTRFEKVDPKYTSQTCSRCGTVDAESRKDERFRCVHCGFTDDADHNAAVNVLSRGMSIWGFPDAGELVIAGADSTSTTAGMGHGRPRKLHSLEEGSQLSLWNFGSEEADESAP